MKDNTVIVIDTSNYKASFAEKVPFKAVIQDQYETCVVVKSLKTEKEYELYFWQILEGLVIEDIAHLINLNKYGE